MEKCVTLMPLGFLTLSILSPARRVWESNRTVLYMKPWYSIIALFLHFTTYSSILKAKLPESATGNSSSKRSSKGNFSKRSEKEKTDAKGR